VWSMQYGTGLDWEVGLGASGWEPGDSLLELGWESGAGDGRWEMGG
jgi:hypothetical protein